MVQKSCQPVEVGSLCPLFTKGFSTTPGGSLGFLKHQAIMSYGEPPGDQPPLLGLSWDVVFSQTSRGGNQNIQYACNHQVQYPLVESTSMIQQVRMKNRRPARSIMHLCITMTYIGTFCDKEVYLKTTTSIHQIPISPPKFSTKKRGSVKGWRGNHSLSRPGRVAGPTR